MKINDKLKVNAMLYLAICSKISVNSINSTIILAIASIMRVGVEMQVYPLFFFITKCFLLFSKLFWVNNCFRTKHTSYLDEL